MKLWGITDTGTVRAQNQDAYHIESENPTGAFAVVCDGMGGAKAGNIASQLAVDTFTAALLEASKNGPPPAPGKALTDGISQANTVVCYRASIDADCSGMGTTLVAAWRVGDTVYFANVGDSRAYYIGEEGIRKVTRDHSLVEDLVLKGKITPEEARQHPQKNLITRALGAEPDVTADLYETPWVEGDFLLLCSDGLSNVLTDQELLYEVAHGGEPDTCCQRLLNTALTRGAPDNVTAVLWQM